jgi:hypothetical protein
MGQLVSVQPRRLTRQRESARWRGTGSCSSGSGGLKQDGKGGLLLLPSTHLLPLAPGGVRGMNSLAGELLSNYSESSTNLLFSAPYSDVALPKEGPARSLTEKAATRVPDMSATCLRPRPCRPMT